MRYKTAESSRQRSLLFSLRAITDYDDIPSVIVGGDGAVSCLPEKWSQSGVYACFNKAGDLQYVAMSRKVSSSIEGHMQVTLHTLIDFRLPFIHLTCCNGCWHLQVVGPEFHSVKAIVWPKPSKSDLEVSVCHPVLFFTAPPDHTCRGDGAGDGEGVDREVRGSNR